MGDRFITETVVPSTEHAVKNIEEIGVWGGLTSRQRRILRSKYIRGEWP